MTQHHFVLCFDTDINEWSLDADTEETLFPNGTVWNEITGEWSSEYLGDGIFDPIGEKLTEQVTEMINQLNERKR